MNTRRIFVLSILLLSVYCQTVLADNSLLGSKVKIELQNGNGYFGKLISTSRDSIELLRGGHETLDFAVDDIRKAYRHKPATTTGLTVGAFTGLMASLIIHIAKTNDGSKNSVLFNNGTDKTVLNDALDIIFITGGCAALGAAIGASMYTYHPIEVESLSTSASSSSSRNTMETGVKITFRF